MNVREIRKKLNVFKKVKRVVGHSVGIVYDHLIVDGQKMFLSRDGKTLVEKQGVVKRGE